MNNLFKRLLAVLTISILMVAAFAGCGKKEDPKPTDIKLTYQYWDLIPNQDQIFAKFTEQYKKETGINVTINGQYVTDSTWQDTLKTQVAAGSGPDVFHMDLNQFSAWRDSVIQPLSPYFDKTFWNQFVPAAENSWKYNDQYYAVSNSISVCAFLYNKDMFKNAGINVDSNTRMTLSDFEGIMAKLYTAYNGKTIKFTDGKTYPYYVVGTRSLMYWWWLFWSYGGKSLDQTNNIAQTAYVDAIMKIADYADKGWVSAAADVKPGQVATAFSTAANVAIYPTGDWTCTSFYRTSHGIGEAKVPTAANYGSLTFPLGNDGKVHAEMYNQGVVMNKNLTGWKAKAAAAFIKYMTTTDDGWLGARGPEVGGLGIPAKKDWNEKYANSWFENPDERSAFVWEANNGVISSPDYNVGSIDLYTPVQDALTLAYNEAVKPGTMDANAVRAKVIEKLEAGQKSLNTQLTENNIKLDNPDAKVQ